MWGQVIRRLCRLYKVSAYAADLFAGVEKLFKLHMAAGSLQLKPPTNATICRAELRDLSMSAV